MSLIALPESITLGAIADTIGAELDAKHRHITISSVATLDQADHTSLCYMQSKQWLDKLTGTKAAAVILTQEFKEHCSCIALVVNNPRLAWSFASSRLFSRLPSNLTIDQSDGISSSSAVAASASIGRNVSIGDFCSVADGAVVGDHTVIASGAAIGEGVSVGEHCYIGANVAIYRGTCIRSGCIIHAGAIIGADGFGFERDDSGRWHKYSQVAGVSIGENVEIGANSTVDSGALLPTMLGTGVKIDNLVQVGHGTQIGDHSIVCAAAAIAGSVTVGKRCVIAGMVGIANGVTLADDTTVLAMSLVASSCVEPGQTLSGVFPARAGRYWTKWIAELNKVVKGGNRHV